MKVKTYDSVGNISEETYIELSSGELVEIPTEGKWDGIGEEIKRLASGETKRIYYREKGK